MRPAGAEASIRTISDYGRGCRAGYPASLVPLTANSALGIGAKEGIGIAGWRHSTDGRLFRVGCVFANDDVEEDLPELLGEVENPMKKALGDRGWTPQSLAILERASDHYGGFETWRALSRIRLLPDRLSGLVPWLKGSGRTFRLPSAFEIRPHTCWARFLDYPDTDHVGIFEDGTVRLERSNGEVVVKVDNHRQSFRALSKNRRWTPLDALYFFGYALTHYHSLPFSLFDARLIRAAEVGARNDRLSLLDVQLPADLPTHSRRQRFYFDTTGRLTRHDYHAEIIGFWARGAHFWRRQALFNGFPISLERHVVARLGSSPCPLTALHATFIDAEVEFVRASPQQKLNKT